MRCSPDRERTKTFAFTGRSDGGFAGVDGQRVQGRCDRAARHQIHAEVEAGVWVQRVPGECGVFGGQAGNTRAGSIWRGRWRRHCDHIGNSGGPDIE